MSSRQTATERQNLDETLDSDYERALSLHDLLENHATGGRADNDEYRQLRSYFVRSIQLQHLVPDFVRDCRTLSQFWSFIKAKFPSYAERTEFLRVEFSGLLEYLELDNNTPSDVTVSEGLHNFDANNVNKVRPAARHAELAVNLSGSVALFLVETFNQRAATDT